MQAETDALMHAEMLGYSRSRGVFAGVALEGSTIRQDLDDNRELYGSKLTSQEILDGGMTTCASRWCSWPRIASDLPRIFHLGKRNSR